jgi:hypothetical protein
VKDRAETVVLGAPAAVPAVVAAPADAGGGEPHAGDGSAQRTIGLIVGGIGVAGLATGAVFGLMASSKWSTAQGECGPSSCTNLQGAQSDQQSASTLANVSTAAFVAGGVAVAAGVVVWLLAPRASGGPTATGVGSRPTPVVGVSPAGLELRLGGF